MIQRLSILLVTSSLVLSAACGSDGGSTIAESFADSVRTTCSLAFECRDSFVGDEFITFELLFGTTEAECNTNLSWPAAEIAAIEASVAAGRIHYNASEDSTCLAAFASRTCPQFWDPEEFAGPAPCATAFMGTVAAGGTCTIVASDTGPAVDIRDCAGQLVCDVATMKCVVPE